METEIERKRWWYPYSEYSTASTLNDGADSE